jgi:hypothetical protein
VTADHQYLIDRAPELSEDEALFMRKIFDRVLVVGRSRYKPWVALDDDRNLHREGDEELFDAVIYPAMLASKRDRERQQRLRCFIADEEFKRTDAALNAFIVAANTACTDCLGVNGKHAAGCPWTVVVPA